MDEENSARGYQLTNMENRKWFSRLKAISKAYPTAWEEMCVEIGSTEDMDLISEWLHRQGCDWGISMERDGWTINWKFLPEARQNPAVAFWKSIDSGDEAFYQVIDHSFRAVDLHLRPSQDFMDDTTVAQAARQKRKEYFKNKKK